MISDSDRDKALKFIIIAQCFGQVSSLCFGNGLVFNYLIFLDIPEQSMVIYMRLPSIIGLFTTLPLAYLSDLKGKSRLGQIGNFIQVIGMACLCTAAYLAGYKSLAVVGGIILFSFGCSLFNSSWFALLDPIIKPEQRGPFFARLRTVWSLFGVGFTFIAQFILEVNGDGMLAPILIGVVVLSIIRLYYYHKIPELELSLPHTEHEPRSFKKELRKILQYKAFFHYCLFILCLPVFLGCITLIYNLYEQSVLDFDSADIVLMGNMAMIGSICGFSLGAFLLKKAGEKKVFLICGSLLSLCAFSFPMHFLFEGVPVIFYTGGVTFFTGMFNSAMSIGLTSMMLHLLPKVNKSIGTSLYLTCQELGTSISAGILSLTIYIFANRTENFHGLTVNVYSMSLLVIALALPPGIIFFNRIFKEN